MRLLIVGGLQGQLGAATKIAMDRGAKVTHASDIEQALAEPARRPRRGPRDVRRHASTSDISCARLAAERICTPVVACGIGTDARRAVDAIRAGAKEYLPLPPDPELIAAVLAAVADESHQLIYEDEAMDAVHRAGRPGRGQRSLDPDHRRKRHRQGSAGPLRPPEIARAPTSRSSRSTAPPSPENLLESELFGHEKGAFTGAVARRIGKFEEANGGTLLLDEISEMDARLQAKLLRAIQEREIDRVGGTKPVKVDIRIIATSNRDLAEAVKHGTFREDLLYRLNVVNLRLPALRERPKDILALAEHFAHKYADANGAPYPPDRARDRAPAARRIPGAAMCASWKTRCIARCCSRPARRSRRSDPPARRHAGRHGRPGDLPGAGEGRGRDGRRRHARPRRPHRRRRRARPDPRHARPLPRQPHPCGEHPRHLDPHAAQQAARIFAVRSRDSAATANSADGGLIETRIAAWHDATSTRRYLHAADRRVRPAEPRPRSGDYLKRSDLGARRRHHGDPRRPDPAAAAMAARHLPRLLAVAFDPDPDDGGVHQEAAGIQLLPDRAADHHDDAAGAEPRLDAPDPRPRQRRHGRVRLCHPGLRQADHAGQLRHRPHRVRDPGDRELRGHHQGFGPHRRSRGALHPGRHARQADGDRRRSVLRPDRREGSPQPPQGTGRRNPTSSAPWTAPANSCAATPSPA